MIQIQCREHIYYLNNKICISNSISQNNNKDRTRRFENDNYKKGNSLKTTFTLHTNRNCVFYNCKEGI